jgi:hypothetical protein
MLHQSSPTTMTPECDSRCSSGLSISKRRHCRRCHRCRILFLSLEFNFAPFSGNGVFARSLVSGLVNDDDNVVYDNDRIGNDGYEEEKEDNENGNDNDDGVMVCVICTRPHPSTPGMSNDVNVVVRRRFRASCPPINNDDDENGDEVDDLLRIWPIDLPKNCAWMRLD